MMQPIQPFANGLEYQAWKNANCPGCKHFEDCDILLACAVGELSPAILTKMGYTPDVFMTLGWPCKAREE